MAETAIDLRNKRIEIYCKELNISVCMFPEIQKKLGIIDASQVPKEGIRETNFKQFVEHNFSSYSHGLDMINPWPDAKEHIKAYKMLKEYAKTPYGAVMIKRVLDDNNKPGVKRFIVRLDDNQTATAGTHFISFPSDFPTKNAFPDGAAIDPMAVIHHEFGHTRYFTNNNKPALVTIQDERHAVIHNSNPVRMLNKYEPRYTYYNGSETINIITGQKQGGRWSFDKSDPRLFASN